MNLCKIGWEGCKVACSASQISPILAVIEVSSIGTLCVGSTTGGDLDPTVQSVKNLSSDGAGVGGVLGCLLWV